MQVFGMPRYIIRGAHTASRLCNAKSNQITAYRKDILLRWKQARADGLNASQAADAVGVSCATLYRWTRRVEPHSRRPHRFRQPVWPEPLIKQVRELRLEYPMWGKAKLTRLLNRDGWQVSESMVGRILKRLMEQGKVFPVAHLRRKAPRTKRPPRPYANRLPKGKRSTRPGEIVQIDTLTISPGRGRPAIKQFTASDPVSRWTCALACRRATANNAVRFLDKLIESMPFSIESIQVDGGSEFKSVFEQACCHRGIGLYELPPKSPKMNGSVERVNGSWRYEFHGVWDLRSDDLGRLNQWVDAYADEFNHFRPHQALDGNTPAEYLSHITAEETAPVSHM